MINIPFEIRYNFFKEICQTHPGTKRKKIFIGIWIFHFKKMKNSLNLKSALHDVFRSFNDVPFNHSYALIFEIHLYQIGLNEAIKIFYLYFILGSDNYKVCILILNRFLLLKLTPSNWVCMCSSSNIPPIYVLSIYRV